MLLLAGAIVPGCTQTTVETFRKPANSRVDDAWVKAGVNFSRYHQLRPEPLEIYFYQGEQPPSPQTLSRIRRIFRDAFLDAIGDDYPLTDTAGPDVLGVRASLVDLKHSQALGTLPVTGRAARLVANGQLTFFMELTDSGSGEVLARAADREKDSTVAPDLSEDEVWAQTEAAARRWAALFRGFLDRNLN